MPCPCSPLLVLSRSALRAAVLLDAAAVDYEAAAQGNAAHGAGLIRAAGLLRAEAAQLRRWSAQPQAPENGHDARSVRT